jgi:23S rRNA pseudouridine2604 synthase
MGFTKRIKYFLVHTGGYTNREATALLKAGKIKIDGAAVLDNVFLAEESEIKVDNFILRNHKAHIYLKFYKPRGFQSSLNPKVTDNLSQFFAEYQGLIIAGRLDKESEGLLLLSTNSTWVEEIIHPLSEKEKEYIVTINKEVTEEFIIQFSRGVNIGGYQTKPCFCEKLNHNTVKIILTEGKNRQIRRMCFNLGYTVTRLVRTRINTIGTEGLTEGKPELLIF